MRGCRAQRKSVKRKRISTRLCSRMPCCYICTLRRSFPRVPATPDGPGAPTFALFAHRLVLLLCRRIAKLVAVLFFFAGQIVPKLADVRSTVAIGKLERRFDCNRTIIDTPPRILRRGWFVSWRGVRGPLHSALFLVHSAGPPAAGLHGMMRGGEVDRRVGF